MSGHRFYHDALKGAVAGQNLIEDPGSGNMILVENNFSYLGLTTAATRQLPEPTDYPNGTRIFIYSQVASNVISKPSSGVLAGQDGSALTSVDLNAEDFVELMVMENATAKQWQVFLTTGTETV